MKFILWLFNFMDRHWREARLYSKGKLATRIIVIIFTVALVCASIATEWWWYQRIGDVFASMEDFVTVLAISFLWVLATFGAIDFNLTYCFIAFRAFAGSLSEKVAYSLAKRADKKLAKRREQEKLAEAGDATSEAQPFVDEFFTGETGESAQQPTENNADNAEEPITEEKKPKNYRWLDFCIGILCLALAVAVVALNVILVPTFTS